MRNLIYLIIRFSAIVLFITLESISFYLIVTYNKSQKEIWAYSSNIFSGKINEQLENIYSFFDLHSTNDSLLIENARLLETIINYRVNSEDNSFQAYEQTDTTTTYKLIPSRICSRTTHLRNNFITLCKGRNDGIEPGMGIVSNKGVVGIVKTASSQYATVVLVLNSQSHITAKIKSKNYSGSLSWNNDKQMEVTLEDVPKHAVLSVGDTIVTSGFGISFPPDIPIGKIQNFSIEGGSNNYNITVSLDYDLAELNYVYAIKYLHATEKESLLTSENE